MKGVAEGRQQVLEQINQDNLSDQRRRMLIRDVFKVIYEVLMVVGGLLVFYCAICLLWCVALSQEYLPTSLLAHNVPDNSAHHLSNSPRITRQCIPPPCPNPPQCTSQPPRPIREVGMDERRGRGSTAST